MRPERKGDGVAFSRAFSALPGRYRLFVAGLWISRTGDAFYTLAIPMISYQLTGSAVVMGSVFAVSVLPVILFGPFAGVMVDRYDSRRVMLAADIARAGLVALIPLLQGVQALELWHLFAISFVLSAVSLLFDLSAVAAIPPLSGGRLAQANAAYQFALQAAELAGPLAAGVVIASIGGYQALWADAASFGAVIWAVYRLAPGELVANTPHERRGTTIMQDMTEGFRWLIRSKTNLALSLQAAIGNFGYSAAYAVFMFYMLSVQNLSAEQASVNVSLLGAGGLLGSLSAAPLVRRFRKGAVIPVLLGIGVFGFLLPVFIPFWMAAGMGFGLVAFCNVSWNTIVQTIRQETVPPELLGRVLGFSRVFTRLAMPLGAMAGSLLAGSTHPTVVFVLAAASKAVEVAIGLCSPIRRT